MRDTAITELEDELWMLAEQGLFSVGECESLIEGKLVTVGLFGTTILLGIEWPRFSDGVPVLSLDRRFPDDGVLLPDEGSVAVEVRIAYHAPVAYELLTVTLRQEVSGHETRRIPLRACNSGRHDIWYASLDEALSAGARMLRQATGGFVANALASDRLPTDIADCSPTEMPEPEDSFCGKDEVIP